MKYLTTILLLTLFASCSQNSKSKSKEETIEEMNYGAMLLESNFLQYAEPASLDSLKSEIIDSFYIYSETNNKIVHIDAEELAEFSFDFFMPNLNKILEKRGVRLVVQPADDYEKSNDAMINGVRINLYTKKELENGNFWESGSRNFFKEINKQMSSQKLGESIYLLYNGNDLRAILLTPTQFKIISDKYKNDLKEIPYLP
jgi:hypothetical protein